MIVQGNLRTTSLFKISKILTDNGKEFLNEIFENRIKENEIEHRRIRPYRPQTNGMVEKFNKQINDLTNSNRVKDYEELWLLLLYYLIDYNFKASQRVLGGLTPYEKMLEWYKKEKELFVCEPTEYYVELLNKFANPNT